MTIGEYIAIGGLVSGIILNAIVYGWKGGSQATTFKAAIDALDKRHAQLEKSQEKLDSRHDALEKIPLLEQRIAFLERNHSLIPKLSGDVEVLKTQAQHSKEMRQVLRRSRPDTDEEE